MTLTAAQKQMIFPFLSRVEDGTIDDMYRNVFNAKRRFAEARGENDDFATVLIATDAAMRQAMAGDTATLFAMLEDWFGDKVHDTDPDVILWASRLNERVVSVKAHGEALDRLYRELTPASVYQGKD